MRGLHANFQVIEMLDLKIKRFVIDAFLETSQKIISVNNKHHKRFLQFKGSSIYNYAIYSG